MANTRVSLDYKTFSSLAVELNLLSRLAASLSKKILKMAPSKYGTPAWWEEREQKVLEELEAGRIFSAKSVEELISQLES